jgi:response regulator RpfG family c-di-GMP phosphodiesterase
MLKDVLEQMRLERGRHFDPDCIDVMLRNIDAIMEIQKKFSDVCEMPLSNVRPLQRGVA